MKKESSLAVCLVLILLVTTLGQTQTSQQEPPQTSPKQTTQQEKPTPQPIATPEDEVVRITTNLVQVDAVITDKDGKQITDIQPGEVEILEDGRSQQITNFSYITTQPASVSEAIAATPATSDKSLPKAPVAPARPRPEQVRRTIALVADDLNLSFQSIAFVRRALARFVDEQMQPADLVAIIRTSAGAGALQQFTSDKRQLHAAIERIRWYPTGRGGGSTFAPIGQDLLTRYATDPNFRAGGSDPNSDQAKMAEIARGMSDTGREALEERSREREEMFAVGTLGAVGFVVRGLQDLPGRKSVLLFSDGFELFTKISQSNQRGGPAESGKLNRREAPNATPNTRTLDALRRLTDMANRASVVINTMDARGLQTLNLTAEDSTSDYNETQIQNQLFDRQQQYFNTQGGLQYLARLTGGISIQDSNDLNKGIQRVLDDQSGYYLIGYRPDETTFDANTGRRSFHKVVVRVKRPGLRVRSRSGFFGVTDEEARPSRKTSEDRLMAALISPFNAADIRLRLTALFSNDVKSGSFMNAMIHINGGDLTFKETEDGWKVGTIDILAYTFGDFGEVVDQYSHTDTVRARGETYESILRDGLIFTLSVPVKKAGAYQFRIAVRDQASKLVGSASQLIEVPDLNKNHLALSGIVLSGEEVKKATSGEGSSAPASQGQAAEYDPQLNPAVRRLRGGVSLQYNYFIYNARLDPATHQPQLQSQVFLYRDGQIVYAGKQMAYDAGPETDLKRLHAGGRLQLGKDAQPGNYILQVNVTDALAKADHRTATQWIDFEIVK